MKFCFSILILHGSHRSYPSRRRACLVSYKAPVWFINLAQLASPIVALLAELVILYFWIRSESNSKFRHFLNIKAPPGFQNSHTKIGTFCLFFLPHPLLEIFPSYVFQFSHKLKRLKGFKNLLSTSNLDFNTKIWFNMNPAVWRALSQCLKHCADSNTAEFNTMFSSM